jgi:hypothetical protein
MHAPAHIYDAKGDAKFKAARRGDTGLDWSLLQLLSCRDPELFWSALLRDELKLPFETPPRRL